MRGDKAAGRVDQFGVVEPGRDLAHYANRHRHLDRTSWGAPTWRSSGRHGRNFSCGTGLEAWLLHSSNVSFSPCTRSRRRSCARTSRGCHWMDRLPGRRPSALHGAGCPTRRTALFQLRGGTNARSGQRTVVEISSIVATVGHQPQPRQSAPGLRSAAQQRDLVSTGRALVPVLRATIPVEPAVARPRHAAFARRKDAWNMS